MHFIHHFCHQISIVERPDRNELYWELAFWTPIRPNPRPMHHIASIKAAILHIGNNHAILHSGCCDGNCLFFYYVEIMVSQNSSSKCNWRTKCTSDGQEKSIIIILYKWYLIQQRQSLRAINACFVFCHRIIPLRYHKKYLMVALSPVGFLLSFLFSFFSFLVFGQTRWHQNFLAEPILKAALLFWEETFCQKVFFLIKI